MDICVFEDESYINFVPISVMHPVFNLRSGAFTIRQRMEIVFQQYPVYGLCRKYLYPLLGQVAFDIDYPYTPTDSAILLVNGRITDPSPIVTELTANPPIGNQVYVQDDTLLAAHLYGRTARKAVYDLQDQNSRQLLRDLKKDPSVQFKELHVETVSYLWELLVDNSNRIVKDYELLSNTSGNDVDVHPTAVLLRTSQIRCGNGARIEAHTVLDAREGPIWLKANARVEPFSHVIGPAVIGEGSRVVGAQIRPGVVLGPVCMVGGEVEESIFLGYSNKYHAGFVGHSYVGEWVNFGAQSTTSDLKNTYGSIKVELGNKSVDSGTIKLGALIGDHVKLGIGTMLTTGTIIGLGCNIFGTAIGPKAVPPFVWGGVDSGFYEYSLDKMVEVAELVMRRRNIEMTKAYSASLQYLFYLTQSERTEQFLRRD